LIRQGTDPSAVSVLTPYKLQRLEMRKLFDGLARRGIDPPRDVCTTDEFQGAQFV
jgi:hypothetical protein